MRTQPQLIVQRGKIRVHTPDTSDSVASIPPPRRVCLSASACDTHAGHCFPHNVDIPPVRTHHSSLRSRHSLSPYPPAVARVTALDYLPRLPRSLGMSLADAHRATSSSLRAFSPSPFPIPSRNLLSSPQSTPWKKIGRTLRLAHADQRGAHVRPGRIDPSCPRCSCRSHARAVI